MNHITAADRVVAVAVIVMLTAAGAGAAQVTWNAKGSAWEDPANWSTGQVPGPDDVAVIPNTPSPAKNQLAVAGTVQVAGIVFQRAVDASQHVAIPGGAPSGNADISGGFSWIINGAGKIVIGAAGIQLPSSGAIIHPTIELAADQAWDIGGPAYMRPGSGNPSAMEFEYKELIRNLDRYGNDTNLVLFGPITGKAGLAKRGRGRMFYVNNTSPDFSGGFTIEHGAFEWTVFKLKQSEQFSFGSGPITLDGGTLCFGAVKCGGADCQPHLMNTLRVLDHNGEIQDLEGSGNSAVQTPIVHFSGAIELGGMMRISCKDDRWAPPIVLDGPGITILQNAPASPGIGPDTFECNGWATRLGMPITDGPGSAGNPFILDYNHVLSITGDANSYAGPTIVSFMSQNYIGHQYGVLFAAPGSRLGKGDLIIQPGGRVHLSEAANLAPGKSAIVQSNPLALGVLGLGYDGIPPISSDSQGVLAVDCPNFDAVSDLSTLGDGRMYLGSRDQGTFVGDTLKPGKDNTYRLGGGSFGGLPGRGWNVNSDLLRSGSDPATQYSPRHWRFNPSVYQAKFNPGGTIGGGLLNIEKSVLVGSANVTIGSMSRMGNGAVALKGPQSFTGDLLVQGRDVSPWLSGFNARGSYLEGVASTTPGQSPFGSPTGAVHLLNSTIQLVGEPGAAPISKGPLTFTGLCNVGLDANLDNLASLTVADLIRDGRGVFTIDPAEELLGGQEKLIVSSWKTDSDLLPPKFLYVSTHRWCGRWPHGYVLDPGMTTGPDFLSYDATGGTGFHRYNTYVADLTKATAKDVVQLAPGKLPAGEFTVRDLKTTGDLTGHAIIHVGDGGLILAGDCSADLDFGNAEAVIYGQDLGPSHRSTDMMQWDLKGKISGSNGITIAGGPLTTSNDWGVPGTVQVKLSNIHNDFTGPITLNGEALSFIADQFVKGAYAPGALGNLNNPIVLNGGYLCPTNPAGNRDHIAPTRTITLGPGGGYVAFDGPLVIDGKITGPGFLGQTTEVGTTLSITNPDNDYSGGTWISNEGALETTVTQTGKLGTGPVLVAKGCCLTCMGDNNIDAKARLTVALSGMTLFTSKNPQIGSLDGAGLVDIGLASQPALALGGAHFPPLAGNDTTLTLGGDDSDFTFYGTIRQLGAKPGDGIGSVTKIGKGTFTLFGHQSYTGPTTVAEGTLILKGSIAGDVIVKKGATLTLAGGAVAGKIMKE